MLLAASNRNPNSKWLKDKGIFIILASRKSRTRVPKGSANSAVQWHDCSPWYFPFKKNFPILAFLLAYLMVKYGCISPGV